MEEVIHREVLQKTSRRSNIVKMTMVRVQVRMETVKGINH